MKVKGWCPRTRRVEGGRGGARTQGVEAGGERPRPRVREGEARGVRPSKEV